MATICTPYGVHQCSKCPGDTEYCCESCSCNLCHRCKENHVKDLKTIDHKVVFFREKINYISKQEICLRHPNNVYIKYCEPCELPVCQNCTHHRNHRQLNFGTSYDTKRQQNRRTIHTIRSEALFYRPVLLAGIKADFKTCRTKFSLYQSEMLTRAQKLTEFINYIQNDFMCNVFCDFDFKHRCLKQQLEMSRHVVSLQRYIDIYEQRVISPLKFLFFMKTALKRIHLTLHTSQFTMTGSFSKENVMELLMGTRITERRNRCVTIECLLKQMSFPEFHQSLTVAGVDDCYHISCVTSDRAWVSGGENLILTNTAGATLYQLEDMCSDIYSGYGLHTMNSESELIYVERYFNIKKLSKDLKTTNIYIERIEPSWKPRCVYWSPSTGDLLVGVYSKVTRYNQSGHLTQTIQHDTTGRELYRLPLFITENNNGDVVVSDYISGSGAVVVTERGGRHRFSYLGHPSGSQLAPRGICTDALSHILVCDYITKTVHMLDKDGKFLSHLLTKSQDMDEPWSLGYDVNSHRLWVGSQDNNKVCVYRYITRQGALTDQFPTTHTEKQQRGHECRLKLMFSPKLHHSVVFKDDIRASFHISCVSSDRVWVSNPYQIFLINRDGDTLHCVDKVCAYRVNGTGLHTVNSGGELIYIDEKFNINKLSNDLKTTTTFIKQTNFTWEPRCVYWSPSTGDLLVGMCYIHTKTGKVTRFNQSGQQTQTIQHTNIGRRLYIDPHYITENNNGDVVVSDYVYMSGAVVVTDRGGRHRFSYTRHPTGSELQPQGICTDALSHILMCDEISQAVLIIDKDGLFLKSLSLEFKKLKDFFLPYCLSYDFNTDCLWVGIQFEKVNVYRYITRQDALTDKHTPCPERDALFGCLTSACK